MKNSSNKSVNTSEKSRNPVRRIRSRWHGTGSWVWYNPGSVYCNYSDMLVLYELRGAPWKLAHWLRFSGSVTFHALFRHSVSFFPPRGLCLRTLSVILRDWYLVKSCLRATSLLNEFFRKLSNFESFVDHKVPLQNFTINFFLGNMCLLIRSYHDKRNTMARF